MRYLILLFCIFISACASTPPVCQPSICLKLKHYTPTQQDEEAATEAMLPANSPLVDPLVEWADLRAELKACNGGH